MQCRQQQLPQVRKSLSVRSCRKRFDIWVHPISESDKKVHKDQNRTEWGMRNQSSTCGGILEASEKEKKEKEKEKKTQQQQQQQQHRLWKNFVCDNRDNLLVRWTL